MPIPYLPRGRHPGKHPSVKQEKTRREESGVVESKEETGGGRRREMERRSRKEVRERRRGKLEGKGMENQNERVYT